MAGPVGRAEHGRRLATERSSSRSAHGFARPPRSAPGEILTPVRSRSGGSVSCPSGQVSSVPQMKPSWWEGTCRRHAEVEPTAAAARSVRPTRQRMARARGRAIVPSMGIRIPIRPRWGLDFAAGHRIMKVPPPPKPPPERAAQRGDATRANPRATLRNGWPEPTSRRRGMMTELVFPADLRSGMDDPPHPR